LGSVEKGTLPAADSRRREVIEADSPLDLPGIRAAVDARLARFLNDKTSVAHAGAPVPAEMPDLLREFLAVGGKRLRPLLCVVGWFAAGGSGDREKVAAVTGVAAALEMFHAFALIHDDIMDSSATRRGQPAIHRLLAARHDRGRDPAAAEQLGTGLAILAGDLALCWADELVHTAGLTDAQRTAVLPLLDAMRTELMYGQYLDLISTGRPSGDLRTPLATIRHKTAAYTCKHPLHIGATLAGADPRILQACTAYALPLGEAFQLRDDLLGTFGISAATGKSRLDDLRAAKHTTLLAMALRCADPSQQHTLRVLVGHSGLTEDGAAQLRDVLVATGARSAVEDMIRDRREESLHALERAPFPAAVTAALRDIADAATTRNA
jgi:geranylgeranyl diphosphate synthase, type I